MSTDVVTDPLEFQFLFDLEETGLESAPGRVRCGSSGASTLDETLYSGRRRSDCVVDDSDMVQIENFCLFDMPTEFLDTRMKHGYLMD